MRTELAALQRDRETSVQPLKKLTANGDTYSRAGTAELKPYMHEDHKKNLRKIEIYIISPTFFHLYLEANGIGDRSAGEHLKNTKTTCFAYQGLGL